MPDSNRRTDEIRGVVDFPVKSQEYLSSREGGMFVRLTVEMPEGHSACCGGQNHVIYDECLVGIDEAGIPASFRNPGNPLRREESRLFPRINNHEGEPEECHSIGLAAVITLGSTGWSGYSQERGYWTCGYADLQPEGKAVYDALKSAYPEGKISLQTWLDT